MCVGKKEREFKMFCFGKCSEEQPWPLVCVQEKLHTFKMSCLGMSSEEQPRLIVRVEEENPCYVRPKRTLMLIEEISHG